MTKHITAPSAEWIDAYTNPPPNGSKVLGLTRGGKLIELTYTSNSIDYIDAWSPYPKIPSGVRERQSERFKYTQ